MLTYSRILWPGIVALGLTLACVPKGTITNPEPRTKPAPRARALANAAPCIKGRVVGEKGKGVAYVFVQTKPKTSPAITDTNGYFEFCHAKKSTGGAIESTKHPIAAREYTVLVRKDGFNAKPRKIQYKGKALSLAAIRLVQKELKTNEVQTKGDKKPQHRKLPGGIIGSHPKGG